ncbi:unnamed protein product, partial [Prorocentrum cordatum]
ASLSGGVAATRRKARDAEQDLAEALAGCHRRRGRGRKAPERKGGREDEGGGKKKRGPRRTRVSPARSAYSGHGGQLPPKQAFQARPNAHDESVALAGLFPWPSCISSACRKWAAPRTGEVAAGTVASAAAAAAAAVRA